MLAPLSASASRAACTSPLSASRRIQACTRSTPAQLRSSPMAGKRPAWLSTSFSCCNARNRSAGQPRLRPIEMPTARSPSTVLRVLRVSASASQVWRRFASSSASAVQYA
jgi:hypothetical protein